MSGNLSPPFRYAAECNVCDVTTFVARKERNNYANIMYSHGPVEMCSLSVSQR